VSVFIVSIQMDGRLIDGFATLSARLKSRMHLRLVFRVLLENRSGLIRFWPPWDAGLTIIHDEALRLLNEGFVCHESSRSRVSAFLILRYHSITLNKWYSLWSAADGCRST
jgi:hypothetical protein